MKKKHFIILIASLALVVAILSVALILKDNTNVGEKISEELRLAKETFRIELNYTKDEYYIYGLKKVKNVENASIIVPDTIDGIPVTKIIDKETDFYGFNNIASIKLGKNIKYIGTNAYSTDSNKVYGDNIFSGATSLAYIDVDKDNQTFVSVDGVLYNKDKTVIIKYPANKTKDVDHNTHAYTILDTVELIYQKAFYCNKSIEIINIPDSVKVIDIESFSDCESLYTIRFGSSIKEIRALAFNNCSNLDTVVLPNSLSNLSNRVFKDCKKLVNITFNSNIEFVGTNLFTGCSSLNSIYVLDEFYESLVELFETAKLKEEISKIKVLEK